MRMQTAVTERAGRGKRLNLGSSPRRFVAVAMLATGGSVLVTDQMAGQGLFTATGGVRTSRGAGAATHERTARLVIDLQMPLRDESGRTAAADGISVDPWGRIYVLDRRAGIVRLFDANGRLTRVLGRPGHDFPGLHNPIGVMTDRSGGLWVVEPDARRYLVFDTAGKVIATIPRQANGTPTAWRGGFDRRGRLYDTDLSSVAGHNISAPVRCSDRASSCEHVTIVDQQPGPTFESSGGGAHVSAAVPFTSEPMWQLDGQGGVWTGRSDQVRLIHQDQAGQTCGEVRQSVTPSPVSPEERGAALQSLDWFVRQGGRVDTSRFGQERPPVEALIVDDEAVLWVRLRAPSGSTRSVFERFASDGRYIGRAESDIRLEPSHTLVVRHHLYAETRPQAGALTLVRLRLVQ